MLMILRNLDLVSYTHFRQANHRARVISTTLQEYQLAAKHGLEGLRSLLRTVLGRGFTIMDLYRAPVRLTACYAVRLVAFYSSRV